MNGTKYDNQDDFDIRLEYHEKAKVENTTFLNYKFY